MLPMTIDDVAHHPSLVTLEPKVGHISLAAPIRMRDHSIPKNKVELEAKIGSHNMRTA
jgi:hypothetical protein